MTSADTIADSHRPLNGRGDRALALSALGGALELYDIIIFVFFAGVIAQIFFPPVRRRPAAAS